MQQVVLPSPSLGHFADVRGDFFATSSAPCTALAEVRELGWQRFAVSGIPSTRAENYKYTNLKRIRDTRFHVPGAATTFTDPKQAVPAWVWQLSKQVVVTYNGDFATAEGLAPTVIVSSLNAYATANDTNIRKTLAAFSTHFADPLVDLNLSFLGRGFAIQVKASEQKLDPLVIVHTIDTQSEASTVMAFNLINIASLAEIEVIEVFVGGNSSSFVNHALSIDVEAGARLKKRQMQALEPGATFTDNQIIRMQRDAVCDAFAFDAGGGLIRHNHDVELLEAGANVSLNAVYLGCGTQHIDHHTQIDHRAAHTFSDQVYKSILNDKARGVFNGKVIVRRGAQQCVAHQLNKNLLIGEGAEVDTKPELQIDTDDIKCSHGATIGRFDDDELFYLMSRALRRDQAERLLGQAYVGDLIEAENVASLREAMSQSVARFFAGGRR